MNCIFCDKLVVENSIEHIIPESLGNKHYILQIGSICRVCNNLFSKFEAKALSIGILAMSRPIAGYATKKGRPAKGQSHGIRFEGNGSYIGNRVTVFGL
ncbi:MAG: HNH endonuclease, partial [Pedobacter sp.]